MEVMKLLLTAVFLSCTLTKSYYFEKKYTLLGTVKLEGHCYLKLDSSIDILKQNNDEISEDSLNVSRVQLSTDSCYKFINKKVRASGVLYYKHTGHHREKALMMIESIYVL